MNPHLYSALCGRLGAAKRRIGKAAERAWACELFLFLLCFGVYLSSLNPSADSGDVLPNYLLAKSIVHSGDFCLDEYQGTIDTYRNYWGFAYVEPGLPLAVLDGGERLRGYRPAEEAGASKGLHIVSAYPPGAAFAASVPYWALAKLFPSLVSRYLAPPFKAISALLIALSVAWMHRALSFLARPVSALGIAAIYGFGTSAWSVASQDLWQHAPSLLLLSVFLCLYLAGTALARRSLVIWSTLPLAFSVSCRLTNGLLLVAFLVYVRLFLPSVFRHALLLAVAGMSPLIAYSVSTIGVLLSTGGYAGGYGGLATMLSRLPEGVAGILVSPGRGLFVYAPVLTFAFAVPLWRERRELWLMAGCALAVLLSAAVWHTWWGGGGYSYRLVLEAVPFLCVLLVPAWGWLERSRLLRAVFAVAALASCYVQVLGAYAFDYSWERHMRSEYQLAAGIVEAVPLQPFFLWRLRDNPIRWYHRKLWTGSGARPRPLGIQFVEGPGLAAYEPPLFAVSRHGQAHLTLYWQEMPDHGPVRVSVRVLDLLERTWDQLERPLFVDKHVAGDRGDGLLVRDEYLFAAQPGMPAGRYWFGISLSNPDTMERLATAEEEGETWEGWVLLGPVEIE